MDVDKFIIMKERENQVKEENAFVEQDNNDPQNGKHIKNIQNIHELSPGEIGRGHGQPPPNVCKKGTNYPQKRSKLERRSIETGYVIISLRGHTSKVK